MIPKFRAWDKVINQMFIPVSIHFDSKGIVDGIGSKETIFGIEDFELMQSTGLTDVNGKEIFEGDIVQCWYEKGFVTMNCGCWSIKKQQNDRETIGLLYDYDDEARVIGNIHEHPELLENI